MNAVTIIRTPTIVVTGIRRAGLNIVGDMLRAGFVPDCRIVFAPNPHREPIPSFPTATRIGLYVDRTATQLLASIIRSNASEGRAPLSLIERRILKRQLVRDFFRARDAAALHFSPLFVFEHSKLIDDPDNEARRLARIIEPHYPFSETRASLAVRRIYAPPRVLRGRFRIIEP